MKSPARTTVDSLLGHLSDKELEGVAAAAERLLVRRTIARVARKAKARLKANAYEQTAKGTDK